MPLKLSASALRRVCGVLFAIGYGALLFVSLAPTKDLPNLSLWDKTEHFIAYAVLALLGAPAFARRAPLALFLLLTGLGIELLQHAMGLGRQADPLDMLANTLGVCGGLLVVFGLERWTRIEIN